MPKGVHSDEFDDILAAEFTPEELRDHRHDRRTKAPEGIVVGSPEYYKWWRDRNKLRHKLIQKKAYLKKRKLILATGRYEGHTVEEMERAIAEVDEQIASLKQVHRENVAAAREVPVPTLPAPDPNQIPFVREMAELYHIEYSAALAIMTRDDYRGDDTFRQVLGLQKE